MRKRRAARWRGKSAGRETEGIAEDRGWERVCIAASGPSLKEEDIPKEDRLIVINNTWTLAPWADVLYACDGKWWDCEDSGYGRDALRDFGGECWSQDQGAAKKHDRVRYIRSENKDGLSFDPTCIHQGQNSGFQAINLAVLFGARSIALLGYDMQCTGGKIHHHGAHPNGLNNPSSSTFSGWLTRFERLAKDCEEHGIEVLNCSRETALTCFPRGEIGQWVSAGQQGR